MAMTSTYCALLVNTHLNGAYDPYVHHQDPVLTPLARLLANRECAVSVAEQRLEVARETARHQTRHQRDGGWTTGPFGGVSEPQARVRELTERLDEARSAFRDALKAVIAVRHHYKPSSEQG
jgi:hypothetical protein